MKRFLLSVLLLFVLSGVWGQVSVTNGSPSFLIDFSNTTPITAGSNPSTAYTASGFEPNTLTAGRLNSNAWAATGWSNGNLSFGGTQTTANTDYTRGATAVSETTGGFYSFTGLPGSALNPTFMIQPGGSDWAPGTLTLRIQNNGTTNLTQLAVSYNIYIRNDQDRSSSFNFSYSDDDVSYTNVSALDYTSPAGLDALGWVLVGTAPSRSTTITGLNIAPGANFYIRWSGADVGGSGSRDEFGLDDINATATFAVTNTISTDVVNTPPFVLADCSSIANGSVDFTSTDVFNAGNVYTAQLSDDVGSFTSPVNIGSFNSTLNSGNILITIPAGTVGGVGYKIRVISSNPVVTGSSSGNFTITQGGLGGCASSHTDYYHSIQTGNWGSLSTWESSPDNTNWISATLIPTYLANTITIQNTHTVTVVANASADQLVISNGATLQHSAGIFTIEDGSFTDMDIQTGGVLLLSSASTSPAFGVGSPNINVATGGIVRVSATGLTGAAAGVNVSNYVYQDQSVLEYTLTSPFSTSGVTYFPNANAATIPIFRVTALIGANVGGASATIFNGEFECNGATVWQSSGTKTFRNGILGTGSVTALASSGKFIINGTTAKLGGSGSLTVPPTGGLEIGSVGGTTVTMTSNKTVTGDISLISTNTYVDLGANNLTVTGTISNGGQNAFIKTNGTGVLTLSAVTSKTFPIGNTSYNPIVISSGAGVDYSARVETGISPVANSFPTYGINRTWDIQASAVNAGVIVAFQYATADANAGVLPQPQAMEILQYSGAAWSILVGNTGINPTGADPAWIISTATGLAIPNASPAPYALGKDGGWILPIDCIISTQAQKRNNTGIISWTVNTCAEVTSFEVQRSVNNGGFQTIGTIRPGVTETDFSFIDAALGSGRNFYRIKVNRLSGAIKYSNTVTIIHNSNDILISSLTPNPVHNTAILTVSTGHSSVVEFKVYNMLGNLVKQWQSNITEGNNPIEMNVSGLPAGMYTLFASNKDAKTVSRFVKQ